MIETKMKSSCYCYYTASFNNVSAQALPRIWGESQTMVHVGNKT